MKKKAISQKDIYVQLAAIAALIVMIGCLLSISYKYVSSEYNSMKQEGYALKDQRKAVLQNMKEFDFDAAEDGFHKLEDTSQTIRTRLEKALWKIAAKVPFAKEKIESVVSVLDILDETAVTVVNPGFALLKQYPVNDFRVGDGFKVSGIRAYVEFAKQIEPFILNTIQRVGDIDLSFVDTNGKIRKYQAKIEEYMELFNDIKKDIEVFMTLVGKEGDRYYMFAAQNSSEIRSAGGFVGSVGTITIRDGVLYVGDFDTIYKRMEQDTPASGNITAIETKLFNNKLVIAHDSEHDPDFRRVAEIWTSAYEPYNDVQVDGVISMTPVVIQKLLKLTNSSISLSDGTVLNGDNATSVIEYEIYDKYFNIYSFSKYSNEYSDMLFEETAKKAMKEFTSSFDVKKIMDYYKLYKEIAGDRTLMIWMKDPEEEQIMIKAGVSGILNTGEDNAVAGVYFSNSYGSKLGIFTKIDMEASEGVRNNDGTTSYQVKVTLDNTITDREINYYSEYILGRFNGTISAYVYLFAPVGGTISDVKSSDGLSYSMEEYLGLQLAYSLDVMVYPRQPITITYIVTTAKGVTEPLTFSSTPTLQEYRKID